LIIKPSKYDSQGFDTHPLKIIIDIEKK